MFTLEIFRVDALSGITDIMIITIQFPADYPAISGLTFLEASLEGWLKPAQVNPDLGFTEHPRVTWKFHEISMSMCVCVFILVGALFFAI